MTKLDKFVCLMGFLSLALICDIGILIWHDERPVFAIGLTGLAVLFTVLTVICLYSLASGSTDRQK